MFGSPVAPQTVGRGDKVAQPANPTREGFIFAGWYVVKGATYTNDPWDFDKYVVDVNYILYAKWTSAITGTKDVLGAGIKVYPNPFTDEVQITVADAETWRAEDVETWHAASLQVINAAGAVVHSRLLTGPGETIRLQHLPPGMYFFRIEKNKQTSTFKTVKIE